MTLPIIEKFISISGEAPTPGKLAFFIRVAGCSLQCLWCFSKNTFLSTPKGVKRIDTFRKGDEVLSYNFTKKEIELDKVIKTFKREVEEVIRITLNRNCENTKRIFVTPEHLFFTTKKGWTKAKNLTVGEEIFEHKRGLHMIYNNPQKQLTQKEKENWKKKLSDKLKGRIFSKEHKRKIQIAKQLNPTKSFGSQNGNYCGGITKNKFTHHPKEWQQLRKQIIKRDKSRCLMCGKKEDIVVHHIDFNQHNNIVSNLCVLCRSCNSRINHGRFEFNPVLQNGALITDIKIINSKTDKKSYTQLAGTSRNKIEVFNIETKNNNYFANRVLVHNCDSKYASQPKQKEIVHTEIEDLLKEIEYHSSELRTRPIVALTGGEILLYRKPLEELVKGIYDNPIQIETNGTQLPLPDSGINLVHYNISPKLSSSGNPWDKAIKPITLNQFLRAGDWKPTFKFVVKTKKDWKEMEKVIELVKIPKEFVYIMPEGTNEQSLKKNTIDLIDKIVESGYNFSPRLQIYLWGNKKGV